MNTETAFVISLGLAVTILLLVVLSAFLIQRQRRKQWEERKRDIKRKTTAGVRGTETDRLYSPAPASRS